MADIVITQQQFKRIHNALYYLDISRDQLEGMLHPDLVRQITGSLTELRAALAECYQQDEIEFDRQHLYYQSMQTINGLQACWSIYEVKDLHQPHPYTQAKTVAYQGHSRPILDSNWLALWQAADGLIIDSGDHHHCFIEGFEPDPSDPTNLNLSTGS